MSPVDSLCVAICVGFAVTSCQATTQLPTGPVVDPEPLPDYSGALKRLFDDEFGGLALGTPWNDSLAEQNALTTKRALSASRITVCSVDTVTEGTITQDFAAFVELRAPGESLTGHGTGDCPRLQVAGSSFSYSILRQSGASLVGKSVVIFIRDFNEGGRLTWHWHVEPNRPELRDLVRRFRGPTTR